jgi:hypothetical protein
MAEDLKPIDEKEFFDLLKDYKSEDFKRARRGLTITSFIVIIFFSFESPIENLKVFGIGLGNANNPTPLLILGIILIAYWSGLFCLYWKSDHELQKEKQNILNRQVYLYEEEYDQLDEQIETRKAEKQRIGEAQRRQTILKGLLDLHYEQKKRTKTAQQIGKVARFFEIGVPIILGIIAISMICILLAFPC